jgi:hypothetical protein
MATIDQYKINIDVVGQDKVKNVQQNLKGLETQIQKMGDSFTRLATIAGAALTTLGVSALRAADDMADLASATGFTISEIYSMSLAAEASGGKFENAGMMIGKFANAIEQAAGGSEEMQDAFHKLGISTKELENLTDQQLYQAVVNGLANMKDGFEKTAIATKFFGKEAKSIDFKQFADQLNQTIDPEIAKNIQLGADAVQGMQTAFRELQAATLSAMAPLLQAMKDFKLSADDAKEIVKILASVVAAAFAAKTVLMIVEMVKAIRMLGGVLRGAAAAQAALTALTGVGLPVVAAAAAAAAATYLALGKAMDDAADSADDANKKMAGTGAGGDELTKQMKQREVSATATQKRMAEQALAAKLVTEQLIRTNDAANRLRQFQIDLIGGEEDYNKLLLDNKRIQEDTANAVADLEGKITAERAKGKDTNQAIIDQLRLQIDEKKKQSGEAQRLNQLEYERNRQLEIQKLNLRDQQTSIANFYSAVAQGEEARLLRRRALGEMTADEAAALKTINSENLNSKKIMTDLEAQLVAAEQAGREKDVENLNRLINLEKQRHTLTKEAIEAEIKARAILNQSQIAGVADAMESISKQFTPYKMAQDAVLMGWQKIGSAVDEFVQTGKFKFSDFAKSVIRDLAAMILKAQIFTAIKATLGFFGLSLPGLAEGGPAKPGKPYIVGEKGPELFVPKSAGTVIPNKEAVPMANKGVATGAVNAPITNNYITNNINALDAKSVAQIFVENRKTLLGSVNLARKEMPYGMA